LIGAWGRAVIDLHCHLLPGLDDGARDLQDAIEMARQAEADGIRAICATPHIRHDHDVRIAELPERLAEVQEAIGASGCRTRVLPGGEVAVTALPGLDDEELLAVALGGGRRWVLLEPAPGTLDEAFSAAVGQLWARGFRALIAHPERHLGHDLVSRLSLAIGDGALVQATAAWLTDPRTREGMLALARAGVIHVLGSDAHSSRFGRPVALRAGLDVLGSVTLLHDHLPWIARQAPEAIVAGAEIRPPY
jgi:protein-tyrosine phosphatase